MLKLAKLFLLLILLTPFDVKGVQDKTLIRELSQMYQSSMTTIFQNQPLINQQAGDKSSLFGRRFIAEVKAAYEHQFGQPFAEQEHWLKLVMIRVMIEVMEDNRTLIFDEDIDYKGLIPAIFAFQLSAKLATKGQGLNIKFTSTPNMIRNQLNQPDAWEIVVMEKIKVLGLKDYIDPQAVFEGKRATRLFTPIKLKRLCLDCHGTPKQNPLNAGKARAQWTNIDVTGFVMENWQYGDFGGGVSVSIYEQDE